MQTFAIRLFVLLAAVASSSALAQTARTRARASTPAVMPAPSTQVVPAPPPQIRPRLQPSDTISPEDRYRSVIPLRDRLPANGHGQWKIEQPPDITAVWQPLNNQLEVFAIDVKGTLKDVWKDAEGFWQPAFSLSAPGLAPAGAPLTSVWYPLNEQLEVFTVAPNGALTVTWKAHNGRWFPPNYITPPNFAPPGANVTAVFQPVNNQLEVFAIDATGAVRLAWKAQNGRWLGPVSLTPPGSAPPGAPISAVWQPLNEQLEVFWIDPTGAMRGVWKQHNRSWAPQFTLTPAGFANPRAHIAAVWQSLNEQLEVFTTDRAGAVKGVWKAHNGHWNAPFVIDGPEVARPGAQIVATWDPIAERMTVVTIGAKGELIKAFKVHNGSWRPGAGAFSYELAKPGVAGSWPTGAALAAVVQPWPPESRRFVFTIDDDQAVREVYEGDVNAHSTPITHGNFTPIYGTHASYCSNVLRSWSGGNDLITDKNLQGCIDFMGITAYCDRQDAGVGVGYSQDQSRRFLQCSSRGHSEDVIEQAEHIAKGVAEGVKDAAVAVIVYSPEIVQGYACLDGVAFACASLAIDLSVRAGAVPSEIKDAVDLVNDASNCVDGDVISCAELGAAGARAVGIDIPGEDAGQVALLTQQCAGEDYGACVRLGERAAMAAGVPMDAINKAAKDAQDCYAGDVDACIALGRQAAKAGIPVGGLADGANNIQQCSAGSLADCQELGQALANVPR
jgi:hypothetical protein